MWEFLASILPMLQAGTGIAGLFEGQNIASQLREQLIPPQRALNQATLAQSNRINEQVTGGYAGLRDRVLNYLQNAGQQERYDINTALSGGQSAALNRLADRGIGSAAEQGAIQAQFARARRDALGGLNERLRGQMVAADVGTTGDLLRSQANLGYQNIQLQQQNQAQLANLIMGNQPRSILTDASVLLGSLRPAPKPEEPSFGDILGQSFAGGLGGAAGTLPFLPFLL